MDFNNLLGHNLQKFGMITVLDVTLFDMNGQPVLELDTLKVSSISAEGSQKEIRGGQGAELLIQYDYGRTATVEITDALASMSSLQYLWGGTLTQDNINYARKETVTGETSVYTLGDVTVNNTNAFAINSTSPTDSGFVDIASGIVSAAATAPSGEAVATLGVTDTIVVYYTAIAANGSELVLSATDFPPLVRLVGQTFLIKESDGTKIPCQIEIPRFKLGSSFSFTLEAEGDASVFDFSGSALSANGDVIKIRTLEGETGLV